MRRFLPIFCVLLLLAGFLFVFRAKPPSPSAQPASPAPLSALAAKPDWSKLEIYQDTITRADFERLLTTVFTVDETWRSHIRIGEKIAEIETDTPGKFFLLRFSQTPVVPKRSWRTAAALPPAPSGQPLQNLHIAIDPGHIGGPWAKTEGRWLAVPGSPPVVEGDMTLLVAKLLKPRLEKVGATVSLVRETNQPVTPLRPETLVETARDEASESATETSIQRLAELLFYRTAEIRARAALINETIKPDLVLCLHFNAESWGDPAKPELIPRTHFHMLLNGAYTGSEIRFADQRFAMVEKLLSGTFAEEAAAGAVVSEIFAARSALPPFLYSAESANARPVNGNSYLWARNLLANRLYDCPVLFMEPYVMNSTIDHPRLAAGDYDGEKEIAGQRVRSIFREYADFLTEGLVEYYTTSRPAAK